MGRLLSFTPRSLIMGVLVKDPALLEPVVSRLETHYGPVLNQSALTLFTYTDYYDREMGSKPYRCYLQFKTLVDPARLSAIKRETNELEDLYRVDAKREVNLDPGLLCLENLILATTKNRSHRIPLSDGIYAEVTLHYENHAFHGLKWTYADYQSEGVRTLFEQFRDDYRQQLKQEGGLCT
ncbi:MAG: DUF4416 family protein [Sphaerochaeta sp.]|uniref:DUF4416 family protein n=1 Tax=Sphaerochaeta sp. TaxID=1972642 RepID=UPI00261158AF|nr:DUF4416 family protein [Sphaerochaeta sp.]MDX9823670.1 DUF4416 family protein [Sphaerochaeta sp.]MEA4865587.1 DUF4416 family protein [Sphaerochaeta sp.]